MSKKIIQFVANDSNIIQTKELSNKLLKASNKKYSPSIVIEYTPTHLVE